MGNLFVKLKALFARNAAASKSAASFGLAMPLGLASNSDSDSDNLPEALRGKVFDFDNVENKSDFEINGSVLLRDLKEDLHIPLESNINETIGGWFAEQIDRMPAAGDTVEFEGFLFTIKKIQAHRVERIQISKLPDEKEEAQE